jgi:hypothetical protein
MKKNDANRLVVRERVGAPGGPNSILGPTKKSLQIITPKLHGYHMLFVLISYEALCPI